MPHYNHRRNYTNKVLDKKIRNIENNLIELKWIDYFFNTPGAITSAGIAINGFNFVHSGDGPSNRTGNIINPTSLQVKILLQNGQAEVVRYMLVWDRQTNGIPLTISGTTDSLLDASVVTTVFTSPRNYNTIERFKILEDTYIDHLYAFQSSTPPTQQTMIVKTHKLHRKIKYDVEDTTTTIANIMSNCLYVILISANGTVFYQPVSIRMYFRDA